MVIEASGEPPPPTSEVTVEIGVSPPTEEASLSTSWNQRPYERQGSRCHDRCTSYRCCKSNYDYSYHAVATHLPHVVTISGCRRILVQHGKKRETEIDV